MKIFSLFGLCLVSLGSWMLQPAIAGGRLSLREQAAFGEDAAFSELVRTKDYPAALARACRLFSIPCEKYRIRINAVDVDGSYATTHPYTDTIRLNHSAFEYLGRPHPGWLAALVSHEMLHTRQSRYIRTIVVRAQESLLRNHYWTATLELEGWNLMAEQADRFRLNCPMRIEIADNLSYYSTILGNAGKAPRDERDESEHYSMPERLRRGFERQCVERLRAELQGDR